METADHRTRERRVATPTAGDITPEDSVRADLYRLLAATLSAPPSTALLAAMSDMRGNETPLGQAIAAVANSARNTNPIAASEEYHELFIGLTRGELLPYASYYLTGFLHEKPLARLRTDMARLDIAADTAVPEPEDHATAVLECMAGLIDGSFGTPASINEQRRFFDAHVATWLPHFFRDLEAAKAAALYRNVAAVGSTFLTIEREAFLFN